MSGDDLELLARIRGGDTVVIRLPGLYQPYPPLLRVLAGERRLVRIGRGGRWGNPYRLPRNATASERDQVIDQYRAYLDSRPDLLAALRSLEGKALGCWCRPLRCHGDVLVEKLRSL